MTEENHVVHRRRTMLKAAGAAAVGGAILAAEPAQAQTTVDGGDETGGADTIQLRRATEADWSTADPTLALGEVGIATDTRRGKVGDGASVWTSTPYAWQSPVVLNVRDFGAVADGATDDSSAIVAAVAEAQSTGQTLFFPSGTYACPTLASVSVTQPLSMRGPGATLVQGGASTTAIFSCTANIDMEGLTFVDGGRWLSLANPGAPIDLIRVVSCTFVDSGAGIFTTGTISQAVGRVDVRDNIVLGNGSTSAGLFIASSAFQSAIVSGNRVDSVVGFGIGLGSGAGGNQAVCIGNTVTNVVGNGFVNAHIALHAVGATIAGNTVANGSGLAIPGILFFGNAGVIANNVLTDAGYGSSAITVVGDNTEVVGNYLSFPTLATASGISVTGANARIIQNEVVDPPTGGITVGAGAGLVVVAGNIVRDAAPSAPAIKVASNPRILVRDNKLLNIAGSSPVLLVDAATTNTDALVIAANELVGIANGTFAVDINATQTIDGAIVKSNSFVDVVSGIRLQGSGTMSDVAVHGNSYLGASTTEFDDTDPSLTATVNRDDF